MKRLNNYLVDLPPYVIRWGAALILLLMPFHAFFSIFLGSIGFNQSLVQSWKEALILLMSFSWLLLALGKRHLPLKLDSTNLIFICIVFLSMLVTILIRPNSEAMLFGIKTNLVAIILFLVVQIPLPKKAWLHSKLAWFIIAPAVLVAALAILQATVLPETFLSALGYSTQNIDPKQIVDGSISFHRAFSTLGGPNQLGTYLILPLIAALVYGIKSKKYWLLGLVLLFGLAIVFSFSRSAWLGAVIAIIAAGLTLAGNRLRLILIVILGLAFGAAALFAPNIIQNNQRLQNLLFHGRVFENRIEGSDQWRLEAISNTTEEILKQPFGHGIGSAGPASFKTNNPVISENWYLQIAYEVGVMGLVLYIIAFALLLGDFLRNHKQPLATTLFATTVGVLVANLFLHSWADSTLVLVMFTLYGLYKGGAK